jgi:hypothetical protein
VHYGLILIVTLASIFVCCWGWHVSTPKDGMPFARSRSVASAIWVVFLLYNDKEKLKQVEHDVLAAYKKRGFWTKASKETEKDLGTGLEKLTDMISARIRGWYVISLFLVTMIWGLGDRFYELMHAEPALTMRSPASWAATAV